MLNFKKDNGVSGGTDIDADAHPPMPKSGFDTWRMLNKVASSPSIFCSGGLLAHFGKDSFRLTNHAHKCIDKGVVGSINCSTRREVFGRFPIQHGPDVGLSGRQVAPMWIGLVSLREEIEEFGSVGALGGSPSAPNRSSGSSFSSNGSMPPNATAEAGGSDSPLVLTPLTRCSPSPELDDLSWLNAGVPKYKGQIVLSDSEEEPKGAEVEADSNVPARGETDDVVMVDVPASNSSDPEDYELKDHLSTVKL
ncbi:hypothetical protein FNV43_RR01181 [Rhamnella rubrinervis]|uniref:Uncharacterized protein n=1 Tax=Rhamnella rubrinervis TaxID=2594499 RepID=A0A8K0HQZ2_9ROSA|nr:hypothetical protein FNV43_RR01181 [Rhamnella rubrinervis]